MSNERRYSEEEIREIFEEASRDRDPEGRALTRSDGLTLVELQAIGHEVGLPPTRIAEAAAALELRRAAPPNRTSLGMPITVGRVVELPRAPTDREWSLLVSEIRQTFGARGKVGGDGEARHWVNGNLQVFLEPTEQGHQLRMGTLKGDARRMNLMGGVALFMAVVLTIFLVGGGAGFRELLGPTIFALAGIGALGANALRLPAWAREREAQMENIGARARALLAGGQAAEPGDAETDGGTSKPGIRGERT